jgi:uncharacterized protein (TIGR03435 family)
MTDARPDSHAGVIRMAWVVIAVFAIAPLAAGQQLEPRFDVVSVKENTSGQPSGFASIDLTASVFQSTAPVQGTVTLRNIPLCNLIARAHEFSGALQRYGLFNGLAGGGSSIAGESGFSGLVARRFDIVAKPPAGSRPADVFAMLRTMLVERFALKLRRETRSMPVYALSVAQPGRLGPALKESNLDCLARRRSAGASRPAEGDPCVSRMSSSEWQVNSGGGLLVLLNGIQSAADRFVVDVTGLSGNYEWHYSYARTAEHPSLPTIYTAVREQLGLRLEPRTMPVEVWVIDQVEMPTPD